MNGYTREDTINAHDLYRLARRFFSREGFSGLLFLDSGNLGVLTGTRGLFSVSRIMSMPIYRAKYILNSAAYLNIKDGLEREFREQDKTTAYAHDLYRLARRFSPREGFSGLLFPDSGNLGVLTGTRGLFSVSRIMLIPLYHTKYSTFAAPIRLCGTKCSTRCPPSKK